MMMMMMMIMLFLLLISVREIGSIGTREEFSTRSWTRAFFLFGR